MAQKDISVTMTSPTGSSTIEENVNFDLDFTVTNSGTVALGATDSIFYGLFIDNQIVYGGYVAGGPNMPVGETIDFSEALLFTDLDLSGTHDMCVSVQLFNGTAVTETSTANNASCQSPTFVQGTAAVEEVAATSSISMYPNPVSGILTIATEGTEVAAVEVYNLAGKLVNTIEVSATGKTTFDATTLQAGIYVVSFKGNNGAVVKTEKLSVK